MNEAFLVFLSLSLSGSLVGLLLLLLKPLIKDRLSKTWQYYIFLIVVVRLLLPIGPDASLMGMVFSRNVAYVNLENNPVTILDRSKFLQMPPIQVADTQLGENTINHPYDTDRTVNMGLLVLENLWLVWLISVAWLLIRKIIGYLRFTHSVKVECLEIENIRMLEIYWEVCKEMHIKHSPGLALNEKVAAPMLVGAVRPVIVLPDGELKEADTRYIFQHELTHYKRLDIIYKWFVQIAVCLHWFNPFMYWISREVNRNCELSCDEAVIRQLDRAGQRAYGDMLLESIKLHQMAPQSIVSITLNEDTKLIKERLGAIMKHRKQSRMVVIISTLLAIVLLCGATFTGVYAATKPTSSAELEHTSATSPIIIDTDTIVSGGKIALGSQHLLTGTTCRVSLVWDGDSSLTVLCTSSSGEEKSYSIESGKEITFQINTDGEYTVAIKNENESNTRNVKGTISFEQNTPIQQPSSNADTPTQVNKANGQTIIYRNVEMRRYEGEDGHPYIHDIKTNNTTKEIVGCQRGMLAFDEGGNPLEIDWWCLDTESDRAYYNLYSWGSATIPSGETSDVRGGWSLNYYGIDPAVDQIAYILYCDKEITFEDGTVWKNPDFDEWLITYEGKTIDVEILENYYPYEQKIEF